MPDVGEPNEPMVRVKALKVLTVDGYPAGYSAHGRKSMHGNMTWYEGEEIEVPVKRLDYLLSLHRVIAPIPGVTYEEEEEPPKKVKQADLGDVSTEDAAPDEAVVTEDEEPVRTRPRSAPTRGKPKKDER